MRKKYLHVNEFVVDSLSLKQFKMVPLFCDNSIFENSYKICISDCWQSMSYYNCGASFPCLEKTIFNISISKYIQKLIECYKVTNLKVLKMLKVFIFKPIIVHLNLKICEGQFILRSIRKHFTQTCVKCQCFILLNHIQLK